MFFKVSENCLKIYAQKKLLTKLFKKHKVLWIFLLFLKKSLIFSVFRRKCLNKCLKNFAASRRNCLIKHFFLLKKTLFVTRRARGANAEGIVYRTQASPGNGTGVPYEAPTWSATTGILRSNGCVSGTWGIATLNFWVPYALRGTFPIPNCVMSSRSFIFSNIYRVGPEIIDHQHLQ